MKLKKNYKIKYNNSYSFALQKKERVKNPFFYFVVKSKNGAILETLGFYSFKRKLKKISYIQPKVFCQYEIKIIALDFKRMFFWLSKQIIIPGVLFYMLKIIGILKYYKNDNYFYKKDEYLNKIFNKFCSINLSEFKNYKNQIKKHI